MSAVSVSVKQYRNIPQKQFLITVFNLSNSSMQDSLSAMFASAGKINVTKFWQITDNFDEGYSIYLLHIIVTRSSDGWVHS